MVAGRDSEREGMPPRFETVQGPLSAFEHARQFTVDAGMDMFASGSRPHERHGYAGFRREQHEVDDDKPPTPRGSHDPLSPFEAAEHGTVFASPEDFYVIETNILQPLHLFFPRRPGPIEV